MPLDHVNVCDRRRCEIFSCIHSTVHIIYPKSFATDMIHKMLQL
jgi:hypothetical protein